MCGIKFALCNPFVDKRFEFYQNLQINCIHFSAGSKLRRLRSAIDANLITLPYPNEYQDVHVIASALKSYLRDLPEPLLTFNLYDQFIAASQRPTEEQRKTAILNTINQLPKPNYENLRYLTKFLGKKKRHNDAFYHEIFEFIDFQFSNFQNYYLRSKKQIR